MSMRELGTGEKHTSLEPKTDQSQDIYLEERAVKISASFFWGLVGITTVLASHGGW